MSKIRVYELAKELGIENKLVIAQAVELGIGGVRSHSNSLHEAEADQIRRAIIRQAIGENPESETVKTRVDKQTGESRTVVEKRKGNIIRRRRRSKDAAAKEAPVEEVQAEAPAEADGHAPSEELEAKEVEGDVAPVSEEVVEAAPVEQEAQLVEEAGEPSEAQQEPQEVQASAEEPPAEAPVGEAEDEGKKAGPKVLGKISLPQAAPKKPEKKKDAKKYRSTTSFTDASDDDDDDKRGRKGKKSGRRAKRQEFTRTDLVDYEGLSGRRTGKTRKQKKRRGEEEVDELSSTEITTPKASKRVVKIDEVVTVGDLANQMSLKAAEIISKLIELGVMATINQVLDLDTATIVAEEFGFSVESISFDEEMILKVEEDPEDALQPRPPVVTVMGHVDHGKTSLLDRIRATSVVDKEHGGITQHIGAYSVRIADGRSVTFIDTPGHAAFTAMRARGADVTDIVILVVAADDGVMPQTVEAIDHAKAAGVPIVVAVNKMDKPDANPDKVKQQLAERGLQPEDWGGDTMFFHVSAMTGQGIEEMLEGLLLQAEVGELRANPDRKAVGTIIESRQDKGRGTVATVLIQRGTLNVGDIYVTGGEYGRVRSMTDYTGTSTETVTPSFPVEITGLSGVPEAGDDFIVVDSESEAKQVASHRAELKKKKEAGALGSGPISLEEFARQASMAKTVDLNLIVKADVHGSLEAVKESVAKLATDKVQVAVVHGGVGAVNESDVQLAIASRALLVGFNVRSENRAMMEAEKHGVELRFYRVIYELIDDVRSAMAGLLEPIREEKEIGEAEVRETFSVPKLGKIAGCYITSGQAKRGANVRLLRDNVVVHEGKMGSLRRFKDDVKEVQSGYECGISIDGYKDVKVGDVMQLFEIEERAATLDD